MPGILPMKVIKIGTSAQSRIAQACDRCRSKKIRCDGLRPCCTQCSSVGFECKTSDKLSRRAFPRGYTESLEERVRALETEVRELKDLLDEKEEKIDMLSKVNAQSPRKSSMTPPSTSPMTSGMLASGLPEPKDVVKVQRPHSLVAGKGGESYFMGSSSTRAFVDAFAVKIQESGRSCSAATPERLLTSSPNGEIQSGLEQSDAPPRLLSDEMINIFLQEWSPLFPVLHRPTFLTLYQKYVLNSVKVQDQQSIAMLNLVFGIATLSSEQRILYNVASCEAQWLASLDSCATDISIGSLQCLVLAQIFYLQKGDHSKLLQYKSIAIGMAQRLGLHTSQKRFTFDALSSETRKKVFWTLYTLDCFSAAALGLPKLLRDCDIDCEYPVDADDENVTPKGFRPGNPGESTRLSGALALFRCARILGKVLEQAYSVTAFQGLPLQTVAALSEELDAWSNDLAPHLKLEFVQDKPCTNVISSRCPLLSLTYHYIRCLIHRPAVFSNLGDKVATSTVSLALSSKRIVQILELLEERNLSFSICLNKTELLVSSGLAILLQAMDLDQASKLMQDSQKTTQIVARMLERASAPSATAFTQITSFMGRSTQIKLEPSSDSPPNQAQSQPTLPAHLGFAHKQLGAIAARYTLSAASAEQRQRTARDLHRATMPSFTTTTTHQNILIAQAYASQSLGRPQLPVLSKITAPAQFLPPSSEFATTTNAQPPSYPKSNLNLDFFSFPDDPSTTKRVKQPNASLVDHDSFFDATHTSPHDSQEWSHSEDPSSPPMHKNTASDDALLESFDWPTTQWEFESTIANSTFQYSDSVPSLSGDSFSEELSNSGRGSIGCDEAFASIVIPDFSALDGDEFESFQDSLTL